MKALIKISALSLVDLPDDTCIDAILNNSRAGQQVYNNSFVRQQRQINYFNSARNVQLQDWLIEQIKKLDEDGLKKIQKASIDYQISKIPGDDDSFVTMTDETIIVSAYVDADNAFCIKNEYPIPKMP
jgi:hypothetical protein